DLRHAAARALVQTDREIELLDLMPERRIVRVVQHAAVVGIRPQEAATHAELPAREAHLVDGRVDRLHRQHGNAEQAIGIRLAVVREPAVVGAAHRGGEWRILDGAREQPEARIQKRGVDAVQIHVGDARVRVEAAGATLNVLRRDVRHDALPRADRADEAEPLRAAEDLVFDQQPLLAVGVDDETGRSLAKRGVDVLVPEIERLQYVTVGVDDVVRTTHGWPPQAGDVLRSEPAGLITRTMNARPARAPGRVTRSAPSPRRGERGWGEGPKNTRCPLTCMRTTCRARS